MGPPNMTDIRLEAWLCAGVLVFATLRADPLQAADTATVWKFDRLDEVGGHKLEIVGSPTQIETPQGKAVHFDGKRDGLFINVNPLAGLNQFTAEVVFRPDPGGPKEQRFLHFQEDGNENRVLFETRMTGDNRWFLDTFLKCGLGNYTLYAERSPHPIDRWHHAAITVDGQMMRHYVNGTEEMSMAVRFEPLQAGRTSVGVRINKISWYQGAVREVRISPRVLAPNEFLKP
jgi:concanavalin A-like lectin/glucanase superfamily protein